MADLSQVEAAFRKADAAGDTAAATALAGEVRRLRAESPAAPQPKPRLDAIEEPNMLERGLAKLPDILTPGAEKFVRSTLAGASSGPVMGTVQQVADLAGRKDISQKIAATAREGNFLGGLLQPEMWLTGRAAGNFIGKGGNLLTQSLRAGTAAAPYGAASVVSKPSDSMLLDRAKQGAVSGVTAALATPVISKAAQGTGLLIDAIKGRVATTRGGKVLRDAAGDKADEIGDLWKNAPDNITATQAAAPAKSDTISALGALAEKKRSQYFTDLTGNQEAARVNALRQVQPNLAQSEAARTAASGPLYKAATAPNNVANTVGVANKIDDLLERNAGNPDLVRELNRIKSGIYDANGNLRSNAEVVSSVMDGLKTSIANKDNKFILGTLVELKDDLAKSIPGYQAAQAKFAEMSPPVNQAKVIDAMLETLKRPAGGERVRPFLNSMGQGESALIKRADQSPRFGGLDDVLNTGQRGVKDRIVSELLRDEEIAKRATAGQGELNDILSKDALKFRIPNLLWRPAMVANKAADIAENALNQNTMNKVYEAMRTGKSAAALMAELPTSERNRILKAMVDAKATPYLNSATVSAQQQ